MTPELNVTLNLAQLIMLGGIIWGLARMSKAVDVLSGVTDRLTVGLDHITTELTAVAGRVSFLEGSKGRRSTDRLR